MSLFYYYYPLRDSSSLESRAKLRPPIDLIMRKLSVAVAVSLLLSAWGNVIAACFCPRYSMDHGQFLAQNSHMPVVHQESSCSHEMSDMKMDDVRMSGVETERQPISSPAENWINRTQSTAHASFDRARVESFGGRCRHCLMLSAPASATASLVAVNPANRLLQGDVPLVKHEVALPSTFSNSIIPFDHGPPGNLPQRHILISVFRI